MAKYAVRVSDSFLPDAPVELYDERGNFMGYSTVGAHSHILVSWDDLQAALKGKSLKTREDWNKA